MALIDELNVTINVDQERLKKIETDMKKLAAATNEVKDNIKGLQSAISELGAAFEKASPKRHARAQKELANQTKDTAKAIQKETKEAKQLGKASDETAKAKEKVAKASKTQADAEEKAAKNAKKAKEEVEGLKSALKNLGNVTIPGLGMKLKDLDKKVSTLFTTITNLKKKLDSFRVASTFGTIGAVIAGISGVVLGEGWRQGAITTGVKQGVYGYGGYTGPMTEVIVAAAQDLGKKFRAADPNQIANTVGELMHPRLGYSVDEVKKLASLILNITGATGTDAGYLSSAFTRTLLEYKIRPGDAENALLQMFDVARKTGVPTLDVAHYMNAMSPTARRTGMGYAEMLMRGGQAWYAGADASLALGAIYREAQALTDEYKGRYQESIETLQSTDVTDFVFRRAWLNLFQKDFPGYDAPGVVEFLQELRTKQLWTHEMESLVQNFASRQGYAFAELYAGDQTYRAQIDKLWADVFINKDPAILQRFREEERDAFNLIGDKLPESAAALSHIDVNVDKIIEMRHDTKNAWDRMIDAIKELFIPLINFVGGIYRFLVPKPKREDIAREGAAEVAGVAYEDRNVKTITLPRGIGENTVAKIMKQLEEKYQHGTFKFIDLTNSPDLIERFWNPAPYIEVDPVGKVMAGKMIESLSRAHPAPSGSIPIEDVAQLSNGSTGAPNIVNNYYKIEGLVNSLWEMMHNTETASRQTANWTGW